MIRQLRKYSKPLVGATVFFFVATLLMSLVASMLGMFGVSGL